MNYLKIIGKSILGFLFRKQTTNFDVMSFGIFVYLLTHGYIVSAIVVFIVAYIIDVIGRAFVRSFL